MTELERWGKIVDDARLIQEFIENLHTMHCYLSFDEGHFLTKEEMIYRYFGIDGIKLEKERRELLAEAQHYNTSSQENRP